jgi:hypothetical protein
VQSEKRAGTRTLIVIEEEGLPLVGQGKIEQAVSIDVGGGNTPSNQAFIQIYFGGNIEVTARSVLNEERVSIVSADVIAGPKSRPECGIVHQTVVAGA